MFVITRVVLYDRIQCSVLVVFIIQVYSVDALPSAFQFSDAVEFCESMADLGKIVIVAALDGTYQRQVLYGRAQSVWSLRVCNDILLGIACSNAVYNCCQGFGDFLRLVPLAESIIKLTAVCMSCYGEASFTKRIGHETQVTV